MEQVKKVKITKVCDCLKDTIKLGEVYEVLHCKRDEYCIRVNGCIMAFVWKSDAEIVKD
jgi:hypothetical protein